VALKDKTLVRHFAACGLADKDVVVKAGKLFDHKQNLISKSHVQWAKGNFWVLSFRIPSSETPAPAKRYKLVVLNDKDEVVAAARNLRLSDAKRGITISSPQDFETLCPNFVAYGTSDIDPGMTLTATLDKSDCTKVADGSVIEPPPTWTVGFGGLTPGLMDLVLHVKQGTTTVAKSGLIVEGCSEIGPPSPP
jgi:hypothetical protein